MAISISARGSTTFARQFVARSLRRGVSWAQRTTTEWTLDDLTQGIISADKHFYAERLADTADYYAALSPEELADFVERVFPGPPHEYIDYHKFRFAELWCQILHTERSLFPGEPFTLIEVSSCGDFLPRELASCFGDHMTYVSVNYPTEGGGTGAQTLDHLAEACLEADLNQLHTWEFPTDLRHLVDDRNLIVVAAEIVEHLLIDVGNFFEYWLRLGATSKGRLLVTTPNYLSAWRLAAIARGLNPQQRYVDPEQVAAGYVHIREFSPREVVDAATRLGVAGPSCSLSFAMPGNTAPQLALDEYLDRRHEVLRGQHDAEQRDRLLGQMLGWEGLVVSLPLGTTLRPRSPG